MLNPLPQHQSVDIDLDALGAVFDSDAGEGFVFDLVTALPRRATSLGDAEWVYRREEFEPDPARFVPLEPLSYAQGVALRAAFVATQPAPLKEVLQKQLDLAAPLRAFERHLALDAALRQAWEMYRGRVLRAFARDWLHRHAPQLMPPGDEDTTALKVARSLPLAGVDLQLLRMRRWTSLCTQVATCVFAWASATPAARWIWLTIFSLLTATVLRATRSALQCSAGVQRGQALVFALIEAAVGLMLGLFILFVLLAVFADGMAGERSVWTSATLQRYLWSDPLLWPASLIVLIMQTATWTALLPRLRRDLPYYPWTGWSESFGQWTGFLIGLALGAFIGVTSGSAGLMVATMACVVLVLEWWWLSPLPGPELRPSQENRGQ
jgi:hypothetical protein